jgi:3'-phosphoadenosine 5'-phosphosulfate sulfotransferase (PAPS reductase)/FAD synthetase
MSDPFKIIEPTVISFSGGRTSAYMLWRVLQSNNGKLPEDAIVCFANTGKEEEATLEFVRDCGEKWNVPIVWLEYQWKEIPKERFKVVDFKTASRNGEPFEEVINAKKFLPNTMMRFCTQELKIFTINRYLKFVDFKDYITMVGVRADEPRRVAKILANKYGKNEKSTPLSSANVTEKIVWDFWDNNNFDLSLAKFSGSSNCDLCFLKGTKILAGLVREKPSRVNWWAKMENKIGARFSKDKPTYAAMLKFNDEQVDMFTDESINCFCGD